VLPVPLNGSESGTVPKGGIEWNHSGPSKVAYSVTLRLGFRCATGRQSVVDSFWIYKLTGHVHCIGWRPPRTAQPCIQPCLHVNPFYRLAGPRP